MKRRSGKFWRDREKRIMRKLGLRPVPGSGSGELYKEDGENDYIICQLKSTERESLPINRLDVEKLIYHADLVNKIPIFVIDFLPDLLLVCSPVEELENISDYLRGGKKKAPLNKHVVDIEEDLNGVKKSIIKSSGTTIDEAITSGKGSLIIDRNMSRPPESYIERAERVRAERRRKQKLNGKY